MARSASNMPPDLRAEEKVMQVVDFRPRSSSHFPVADGVPLSVHIREHFFADAIAEVNDLWPPA